LDHINGKKHQRALGTSLRPERATLEQVRARLQLNKNIQFSSQRNSSDSSNRNEEEEFDLRMQRLKQLEEDRKHEQKRKKLEQKKQRQQERLIEMPETEELDAGLTSMGLPTEFK